MKFGNIPEESLLHSSNPLIEIQTMPIKVQIKKPRQLSVKFIYTEGKKVTSQTLIKNSSSPH